jgi:hypothetical protein
MQCQECAKEMLTADPELDNYPLLCEQISDMFRKAEY